MSQQTHSKTKYKVVFRPSKAIIKVALLGVLVLSSTALIAIHSTVSANETRARELEQQEQRLEQENDKLREYNEKQGSEEGVQQVAQEEQGMVDPDTVIYDFG